MVKYYYLLLNTLWPPIGSRDIFIAVFVVFPNERNTLQIGFSPYLANNLRCIGINTYVYRSCIFGTARFVDAREPRKFRFLREFRSASRCILNNFRTTRKYPLG